MDTRMTDQDPALANPESDPELVQPGLQPRGGVRGYLERLNNTPGRKSQIQRYFTIGWLAILAVSVAYVVFRGRACC